MPIPQALQLSILASLPEKFPAVSKPQWAEAEDVDSVLSGVLGKGKTALRKVFWLQHGPDDRAAVLELKADLEGEKHAKFKKFRAPCSTRDESWELWAVTHDGDPSVLEAQGTFCSQHPEVFYVDPDDLSDPAILRVDCEPRHGGNGSEDEGLAPHRRARSTLFRR